MNADSFNAKARTRRVKAFSFRIRFLNSAHGKEIRCGWHDCQSIFEMSEFLTREIWPRLTGLVRKAKSSQVAVAYLGKGASRLLPLKASSKLIVDLSENAVKAGQTSPQEILKLVLRGVNVSSVGNLHAKVFVIGNRAFIGSANASFHSAQTLVEAMIETTENPW